MIAGADKADNVCLSDSNTEAAKSTTNKAATSKVMSWVTSQRHTSKKDSENPFDATLILKQKRFIYPDDSVAVSRFAQPTFNSKPLNKNGDSDMKDKRKVYKPPKKIQESEPLHVERRSI